jgi:hypothetical protein
MVWVNRRIISLTIIRDWVCDETFSAGAKDNNQPKKKKKNQEKNYVEQLLDRRRRRCRRPSDSPPSLERRGQWLDPGRKEWCRRHKMLRRTRLFSSFPYAKKYESQRQKIIAFSCQKIMFSFDFYFTLSERLLYDQFPLVSLIVES